MDTFERRWRLLETLLSGPKTRGEIWSVLQGNSDETGLRSESCLSDDVKALRSIGIGFRPLAPEDKKTKQAYELDFSFLPLLVSPEDAASLQVATNLLKALDFSEASNIRSLLARVPFPVKNGIIEPSADELLSTRHSPYDPEVIRAIREGLQQSRGMMITYQAVGKAPKRYYIDKATIVLQEGHLYLQAHCPKESGATKYQQNREFRLDRFVKMGDTPIVEVLPGSTKEREFPAFTMELLVSPYLAPYFTCSVKHQSYLQEDGSLRVRTQEAIILRAVRRVLSYGEQVKVIGPGFIVEELQKTIAHMAGKYSDNA